MYSALKEETVWQMDRFNSYINERFRVTKGLPKDWVFNGFTVSWHSVFLLPCLSPWHPTLQGE